MSISSDTILKPFGIIVPFDTSDTFGGLSMCSTSAAATYKTTARLIDVLAEPQLGNFPLRSCAVGSSLPFSRLSLFVPHTYI
jgi:hypothetical protein